MKKHLNWFTIMSLATLAALIIFGVFIIVTDTVTLDILAAGLIMGIASITAAILSLHDS